MKVEEVTSSSLLYNIKEVFGSLDKDLGGILSSCMSQELIDCINKVEIDIYDLFIDKVAYYTRNDPLKVYDSDDEVTSTNSSSPHVNMIYLTLNESLDESAVSEESGDFSHSNTMDTLSETSLKPSKTYTVEKFQGQCKILPTEVRHLESRKVVMSGSVTTVQRTVVTIIIS